MDDDNSDRMGGFGALVGWTHQDLGDRVMLRLQSRHRSGGSKTDPVDEFHYILTKNQAAVLANFLFGVSGKLPQPKRRVRWFR